MTVSLAEATAAARRISESANENVPAPSWLVSDALVLAGFVLAGDTERLRAALERVAKTTALPYAAEPMLLVDVVHCIACEALAEGGV